MAWRFFAGFIFVVTLWGCGSPQVTATALVTGKKLGANLYDVKVSERGRVFVRTSKGIRDVGGAKWVPQSKDVREFAFSGSRLVSVAGTNLWQHMEENRRSLLNVHSGRVRLAADANHIYMGLYAGSSGSPGLGIFVYTWEQGHQQVLELPQIPSAMTIDGQRVIMALGPALFSFELDGQLRAETVLAGFDRIESLAPWPDQDALLLSDGNALYALLPKRGQLVLIFADAGGPIAVSGKRVYLLSRRHNTLYQLDGLGKALHDEKRVRPLSAAKAGDR